MGKKDITLQDFLGDPYIFADLFNGCCFGDGVTDITGVGVIFWISSPFVFVWMS